MGTDLVLLASGQEQHIGVLGVQESRDSVLSPPLPPVGQRLPPAVVSVDGLVPEAASPPITLDFPVPDMPVSRTRFTAASLRSNRHRLLRGDRD